MKENVLTRYIRGSFEELTKVTWPTKNQAVKLTVVVLVMCVVIALFLGAVDYLFNLLYQYLLSLAS
jgi:preprotein translocase subunit SecE